MHYVHRSVHVLCTCVNVGTQRHIHSCRFLIYLGNEWSPVCGTIWTRCGDQLLLYTNNKFSTIRHAIHHNILCYMEIELGKKNYISVQYYNI